MGLRVDTISKTIDKKMILKPLSFEFEDNSLIVVIGPSGCGKSTLLHLLAGLLKPDTGSIFLDDKEITQLPPIERDAAIVFQDFALYPQMTVRQNIAFPLKMAKMAKAEIEEKVSEVTAALGLEHCLQHKPDSLSGGEKQKVAIGRAVVRQPQLFLFDEPLSNIDAKSRSKLRADILRLHKQLGVTSVYVTHDQFEAMTLADYLIIMNDGKIEQIDTPLEVYKNPANLFVAEFMGYPKINTFKALIEDFKEDRVTVLFEGQHLDLKLSNHYQKPKIGDEWVLALRPEEVVLAPEGQGIEARIDLIERFGSKLSYIHTSTAVGEVVLTFHELCPYQHDDHIFLQFNQEAFQLFKPQKVH